MRYGYENPRSAQLELTAQCNNKCIHCYNYWRSSGKELPSIQPDSLRLIIENLKINDINYLAITGGEPMLYPELFLEALNQATAEGISCWINSNLTLLTAEIAKKLKESKAVVRTSVLSYDPVQHNRITCRKGSFEETIRGIKLLSEFNVSLHVNMVVMKLNVSQVYDTGQFINNLGITKFSATKVSPTLYSKDYNKIKLDAEDIIAMLDSLMLLKQNYKMDVSTLTVIPACIVQDPEKYKGLLLTQPCIAGKTECAIAADGSVKPCVRDDKSYGNAIHENIAEIWVRWQEWENGSLIPKECTNCNYLLKCGGGCRIDSKCTDCINGLDPYAMRKK
ncbi:radical SAM protein [bacterium]|nr:radical SAM protein [bacterium]